MDSPTFAEFLDECSEVSIDRTGVDTDADDLEIGDKTENISDKDDKSKESISDPETIVQYKGTTNFPCEGSTLVNLAKNLSNIHLETHKYLINFFTLQ